MVLSSYVCVQTRQIVATIAQAQRLAALRVTPYPTWITSFPLGSLRVFREIPGSIGAGGPVF